jgi:hypothetical protein
MTPLPIADPLKNRTPLKSTLSSSVTEMPLPNKSVGFITLTIRLAEERGESKMERHEPPDQLPLWLWLTFWITEVNNNGLNAVRAGVRCFVIFGLFERVEVVNPSIGK